MKFGLYEQLINKALSDINEEEVQIEKEKIDREKAPGILAKYFAEVLENGLKDLKEKDVSIEDQLSFCNYLISKVGEKTAEEYYESQK